MSTRSATNKRTTNREYAGATRKSAASAKPARSAAGSVRVEPASAKARRRERDRGASLEGLSKEEKRERKREARARDDRMYSASTAMLRQDEEYRRYRRIFWVVMVIALVMLILLWFVLAAMGNNSTMAMVQIVGIVIAYALVIGAFIFDFVKIRPLRNYYRGRVEGMSDQQIMKFLDSVSDDEEAPKGKEGKKAAEPVAVEDTSDAAPKKRGPKKNHRSRR